MRHAKSLFLATCLLSLGSCSLLGDALPTSLSGIVEAASSLGGDLGGLVGNLNVGDMLKGTQLEALTGLMDTGKGLAGGLDALPEEVTSKFSIDGLKGALGNLTNFDIGGLRNATTADGQSGFLSQLGSIASNIGAEADTLKRQIDG